MTQVAKVTDEDRTVVRPLGVLVKLIREDLAAAETAAKQASTPYYVAAGLKMLEAKQQLPHGEFRPWISKHFRCGVRNAQLYMSVATASMDIEKRNAVSRMEELSFREAIRQHTDNVNFGRSKPDTVKWQKEVRDSVKDAREAAKRLKAAQLTQQQERDAERKLALQLIDIGFKTLAAKLHPDKGGSRDAMSRLNRVRDRLKNHA